ncbi:hypothetical protein ES703_114562 [subsurface metagenome]
MAPFFAAGATFFLAWAASKSIKEQREERIEERQRRALERIRYWAEEVIELVTRPTRHKLLGLRKLELQALLHVGNYKALGILKDAELIDHNLELRVRLGNLALFKFDAMLGTEEDIAAFKAKYHSTDTINPIRDATELVEVKKELLPVLIEVINLVTERLVPRGTGTK